MSRVSPQIAMLEALGRAFQIECDEAMAASKASADAGQPNDAAMFRAIGETLSAMRSAHHRAALDLAERERQLADRMS